MSAKFTAGPWEVARAIDGHDRPTRIVADGKTVARADAHFGRPHHRNADEANARLIAAAPELLEQLRASQRLLRLSVGRGTVGGSCGRCGAQWTGDAEEHREGCLIAVNDALIARATGAA